jgi:UDP-4-amino-4,6-dideoxy-N-acetyl-beta-L-altrosamine N-acetyltransferase
MQSVLIGSSFSVREYTLRPATIGDLEKLLEWRNSERVLSTSFSGKRMTAEDLKRWADLEGRDHKVQRLVWTRDDSVLGVLTFSEIDIRHLTAHWGFYIGDETQSPGSGTRLAYCGMEYGFRRLKLRKVMAEILVTNTKSIYVHAKLGFLQEGRFREHVFTRGEYRDVLIYALFVDDWVQLHRDRLQSKLFWSEFAPGPCTK